MGQLLYLTATPLVASACLSSPATHEPSPACCSQHCDLCACWEGARPSATVLQAAFQKCSALTMKSWFSGESGTYSAILQQHNKFSKALGHKQFLLTLSMSVYLSTAAASFAGLSSISFPTACVSTMTYHVRDIFQMRSHAIVQQAQS